MKNIDALKDKKIVIPKLMLEVTERCNLKCAHCLRGDSCNISMSLQTIDSIFKQVSVIECLSLSGGEPFLAPNVIKYIVMKAREYGVTILKWDLVTNGTIYNDETIKALFELDDYCTEKDERGLSGKYEISSDKYHTESIAMFGKKSELIMRRNIIMNKLLPWYSGERGLKPYLINDGRSLGLNARKGSLKARKYQITVVDNEVRIIPSLYINARGIVTLGDSSYETQITKYNFGNINESHILDCIKNNLGRVIYITPSSMRLSDSDLSKDRFQMCLDIMNNESKDKVYTHKPIQ